MRQYLVAGLGLLVSVIAAAWAGEDAATTPTTQAAALPRGLSDPAVPGPMDNLLPFLVNPADTTEVQQPGRDGLAMSASLPKMKYAKYEPVVFTLGVANRAKDPVDARLPVSLYTRLLSIDLRKDGQQVTQQVKWSGPGSNERFRIPAGQRLGIELDLSQLHPLGLEPGRYSLKLGYVDEKLSLPVVEMAFTVTPPAAQDEAAAKDLHAARQSGEKPAEVIKALNRLVVRHKDSLLIPQIRLELIGKYATARQAYSCAAQSRLIEQSSCATARMKVQAYYMTARAMEVDREYLLAIRFFKRVPGAGSLRQIAQLQPKAKQVVEARIRQARQNIRQRAVEIVVHQDKQRHIYSFLVPRFEARPYRARTYCTIAGEEADRILQVLIDSGFFEMADSFDFADPHYPGQTVSVRVHTGRGFYEQNIGWGDTARAMIAKLRQCVKDKSEAATALDAIITTSAASPHGAPPATQPAD